MVGPGEGDPGNGYSCAAFPFWEMLFKDSHNSLLDWKNLKGRFPNAGQTPGLGPGHSRGGTSALQRGIADRPVALAAAEWEWLSRHAQGEMPTPV